MKGLKYIGVSLIIALGFGFSGCGGGESDSANNTPVDATTPVGASTPVNTVPLVSGQFIDAPVEGLSYDCSSGLFGVTDSNGTFTCKQDDNVTFKIGDLVLGSSAVRDVITPLHLYTNTVDTDKAYNISQLLHSLDDDGNPDNNIKLDLSEISLSTIDVNADSNTFENALASTLASTGKTLYNREQAQAKMYSYIESNAPTGLYGLEIDVTNKLQTLETLMCAASQKLVEGECQSKTCKDDTYGCPTCTIDEDLIYGADGSGSCEEKTCSEGLYLIDGNCVENQVPTAIASVDKTTIMENESITLDASGSSDDGTIVSYSWKEGGTVLSTALSFSIPSLSVGVHTITLTVTDNNAAESSDSIVITVNIEGPCGDLDQYLQSTGVWMTGYYQAGYSVENGLLNTSSNIYTIDRIEIYNGSNIYYQMDWGTTISSNQWVKFPASLNQNSSYLFDYHYFVTNNSTGKKYKVILTGEGNYMGGYTDLEATQCTLLN